MKTILQISSSLFLAGLVLVGCTDSPESDEAVILDAKDAATASGDTWNVNADQSKLEWVATKVSGYHVGSVPVKSGQLVVNSGQLVGGNFVIDMKNIAVTGPEGSDPASNKKLLGHLQSPDFFEVETHPEAKFEVTGVEAFSGTVSDTTDPRQEEINEFKVANPTHTISGNLTIKGVSKNIQFPAKVTVTETTADAVAKFNIDRQQWNIAYPGKPDDLIRDQIHMGINIKASK